MFRPKMVVLSVAALLVAGSLAIAEFQQPLPQQDRDAREPIPRERTQLPRPERDTHVDGEAVLVRSSQLEEVRNPADEKLASVSEYVIDMNNGKVKYVILSHGGFLGIGEDLLPVPIEALSVRRDDDADKRFLVLNMDREKLESAPSFDSGEWPDFNDREWSQRINQFYGVTEERRIDAGLPDAEVQN
jgi:hypothetical protein